MLRNNAQNNVHPTVKMALLPYYSSDGNHKPDPAPNNHLPKFDGKSFPNSPLGRFLAAYFNAYKRNNRNITVTEKEYLELAGLLVKDLIDIANDSSDYTFKLLPMARFSTGNAIERLTNGTENAIILAGTIGRSYIGRFSGEEFTWEFMDISREYMITDPLFDGVMLLYGKPTI